MNSYEFLYKSFQFGTFGSPHGWRNGQTHPRWPPFIPLVPVLRAQPGAFSRFLTLWLSSVPERHRQFSSRREGSWRHLFSVLVLLGNWVPLLETQNFSGLNPTVFRPRKLCHSFVRYFKRNFHPFINILLIRFGFLTPGATWFLPGPWLIHGGQKALCLPDATDPRSPAAALWLLWWRLCDLLWWKCDIEVIQ